MLNTTITFAGNLADDPELTFTPSGTPVVTLKVLVNRRIQDQAGVWVDAPTPTSHNCKLYGPTGENIVESVGRGDRVVIHGEVRTESWTDKESGEKRYKDLVMVEEIGASLKWANVKIAKKAREGESSAQAEDPWSTPAGV